jgi:hypothetical protein
MCDPVINISPEIYSWNLKFFETEKCVWCIGCETGGPKKVMYEKITPKHGRVQLCFDCWLSMIQKSDIDLLQYCNTNEDACDNIDRSKPFSHIGYKIAQDSTIVQLYIPSDALTNISRTGMRNGDIISSQSYRCNKAYVLAIFDKNMNDTDITHVVNHFYEWDEVVYRVDAWVYPSDFDRDIEKISTSGIHYFLHPVLAQHWLTR